MSKLPNAAQLAVSHDGKTLYLASEVEQGVVQALRVEDNGELSELNQVASGGAGPVYLSLTPNGQHLLVANYVSGSIAVLPVKADGSREMPRINIRIRANRVQQNQKPL